MCAVALQIFVPHERRATLSALAALFAVASLIAAVTARPSRLERMTAPPPAGATGWFRQTAGERIDRLFGERAPLARALLIADQRDIAVEVRDRYATSGMIHMLSISGLHVGIVAAAIEIVLMACRLRARLAAAGAVTVVLIYVVLLGMPPPAVRSAVMFAAVTAARSLKRPASPWGALAVGAWVPLVEPLTALDLGYQLSVGGMCALTATGVLFSRGLLASRPPVARRIAREIVASVAATIASAPLVAWHFGRVSLAGPLANIAAGPVIGVLQPALFLTLVLPSESAARLVADACVPLIAAFDGIAAWFAALPLAAIDAAPTALGAALASAAAGTLLFAFSARRRRRPLAVAGVLACAAVALPPVPLRLGNSSGVEVHVLDVGQGDAIALRTPRGNWVLFDAGRAWKSGDAARATVIPLVRRLGGRVHALVLSHPHADHIGGAASVIRWLRPDTLFDPGFVEPSGIYREVLASAARHGTVWRRVAAGEVHDFDGVTVAFLAPDSAWAASLDDANEASIIALVRYGRRTMLLTGDAERGEEEWLLSHAAADLDVDVLKVGHHGSETSSTRELLDRVTPALSVVSVGAGNAYGHPDAGVMRALDAHGLVLRTDWHGTVVILSDGVDLRARVNGVERVIK